MQACAVCQQETDKCCSLCFKIFYCSPSHQEVHWHMTHKYSCQGRQLQAEQKEDQFRIYGQSVVKSGYKTANSNEQDAKTFLSLFNDRLELRKIVLAKYLSAREANSPPLLNKQLVRQAQQLSAFSNKVSQHYRTGLSQTLDQEFGLITNSFIIKHDELLDRILLARCYQLTLMQKELKQSLIYLSNEVENYPQSLTPEFVQSYKRTLMAVLDLSESMNFDKVSEKMYANYIRIIERMEGIWQQAYAYFNMGLWYARKTYFLKALKCFNYAFELVLSNKSSRQSSDNATIFKGDAVYNIALCLYSTGDRDKAFENMQEAYRLRAQGLGKSSIEASDCLYTMAKWSIAQRNYENCLQYVTECLRIRKANPSFQRQLHQINSLIGDMYEQIRKDREQSEQVGNSKNERYFQRLLEGQSTFRQSEERQSFTKRLLQSQKQMVTFKLIITPQLADTFSSLQWSKVGDLIELVDTKMQKEQAIRLMLQSQFSQSLTEQQRTIFIKLNKFV